MTDPAPHEARSVRRRAPGWIWAVPLAAAAVVGWLLTQWLASGAVSVTVRFVEGRGIGEDAEVHCRGIKVGQVTGVRVEGDPPAVALVCSIDGALAGGLRQGARFWIEEPDLSSGHLERLTSGSCVRFEPGPGAPAREFVGLDEPPIIAPQAPGRSYVLHASDAGSIGAGAPVRFHGIPVGQVEGVSLEDDAVAVRIFVRDDAAARVRAGSRFWRGGGLSLATAAGDLRLPSLAQLLGGGVEFDTPSDAAVAGAPAGEAAAFQLFDSRERALAAMPALVATYVVELPDDAGGLSAGSAVEMRGIRIGAVRAVSLTADLARASYRPTVTIAVDARLLGLEVAPDGAPDVIEAEVDALLSQLVAGGWRARVSRGLLPGGASIAIVPVDGAAAARLDLSRRPPTLPATGAGGLGALGEQAAPLLARVGKVLEKIDLLLGPAVRHDEEMADLIREATRAAAALRELASYLARHPEAAITGRKEP